MSENGPDLPGKETGKGTWPRLLQPGFACLKKLCCVHLQLLSKVSLPSITTESQKPPIDCQPLKDIHEAQMNFNLILMNFN